MNKNSFEIMKMNIVANMLRVQQLLEETDKIFVDDYYYSINKERAELKQRMKLLRKDTLQIEKILKGE